MRTYDNYWNVDVFVEYLMERLPQEAQLQLARLSSVQRIQRRFARVLVGSTATICAGLAAIPIPLADIIPITSAQIGLIIGIAHVAGRQLSRGSAKEFMTAMGSQYRTGFALWEGGRALVKFVFPGAGSAVSAGVAFAGTWGVGEAAVAYFVSGQSVEAAKQAFKLAKKKHREPDEDHG